MTSKKTEPGAADPDNPEWTSDDFAQAAGPEALSDAERAAFPKTTGSFERIMAGLEEAKAISAGTADPASFRVHVPGKGELTEEERAAWMRKHAADRGDEQ